MSRRTYGAAERELEQLRGEIVEDQPGRATPDELAEWRDDPVGWDREAGREPTDYQAAVMRSVSQNKLTAWRGAHGVGKEWAIGSLAVWAAYARRMLVLVVSATEQQVIGQTMAEVRKAWRAARKVHGIGGQVFRGAIRVGDEDRIVALTGSASRSALTGWHDAENGVAVLISEGQGERLEEAAYDAAFGNVTTDKGRILAAGNPVRPTGRFYEVHQKAHWNRLRTSAFDTPNVKAGKIVRPGFPQPDWPEQIRQEYGERSGFYKSRVLAEFPEESEEGLYRREWLNDATERWKETEPSDSEKPVCALDPARFGPDASVLAIRRGPVLEDIVSWEGRQDTMRTAEKTLDALEDRGLIEENCALLVDEVGVGGGVLDRLREKGYGASGFNGGRQAHDSERFFNRRAESYWRLRRLLERGEVALPDDEELFEELLALRWRPTPQGKVQLERKDDLKGRLGRSPDKADAVSMAFGVVQRPTFERTLGGPEMGGFVT